MPILSMKLFDHFGNHILDLNKAHYITYDILIKLNQRRSRYFIIPYQKKQLNYAYTSIKCRFSTATMLLSAS